MRDVLEELLHVADEEDESSILEQLLRQADTRGASKVLAQRETAQEEESGTSAPEVRREQEQTKMPELVRVQDDLRPAQTRGTEQQEWPAEEHQKVSRSLQQAHQTKLRGARGSQHREAVRGLSWEEDIPAAQKAGQVLAEEFSLHTSAAALVRQLERSGQAVVRSGTAVVRQLVPEREATAVQRQPSVSSVGSVKQVDRAFERDARRYDGKFYLY